MVIPTLLIALAAIACQNVDPPMGADLERAMKTISDAASAGDLGRAVSVTEGAVEEQIRLHGREHLDVSRALDVLARLYLRQGRLEEAERAERRALPIIEKTLGREDIGYARVMMTLSQIKFQQKSYSEAERISAQCLKLLEKHFGKADPELIPILAIISDSLCLQRKFAEASRIQLRLLEIVKQVKGTDDLDVAKLTQIHAATEIERGRFAEAKDSTASQAARSRLISSLKVCQ
jgi:tetratricopeptide (TPR) repeat protein